MSGHPTPRPYGFVAFALVSGTGFVIDVALTMGLVAAGLSPFWASLIGAGTAVTFVYVTSRLGIFGDRKVGPAQDYALYILWQVAAVTAASLAVAALAFALLPLAPGLTDGDPLALTSGAAKVLVTPLTLTANYLFMRWLTQRSSGPALATEGDGT
ncbi:MAG: GtrA family protein [Pseudomonadota bacterium]